MKSEPVVKILNSLGVKLKEAAEEKSHESGEKVFRHSRYTLAGTTLALKPHLKDVHFLNVCLFSESPEEIAGFLDMADRLWKKQKRPGEWLGKLRQKLRPSRVKVGVPGFVSAEWDLRK